MFGNLTAAQKISICGIIVSAIAGSTAQFTPIFGPTIATDVASVASFLGTIINGIMFVVTGQGAQVKNVAAMPGVSSINVNAQANPVLAQIAVDQSQSKVAPTPEAATAVQSIAKNA
jgi:hypothetical protein